MLAGPSRIRSFSPCHVDSRCSSLPSSADMAVTQPAHKARPDVLVWSPRTPATAPAPALKPPSSHPAGQARGRANTSFPGARGAR